MGGDNRGEEYEIRPNGGTTPEPWEVACGHPRERQDPVFRYHWRMKNYPDIMSKVKYYPDWHGLVTLKMCGVSASDPSMLSRFACFDLATATWNEELIDKFEFPRELLPKIVHSGDPIDIINDKVAEELGLPKGVLLVSGGCDVNCATMGLGVTGEGVSCLISGSYENMIIMSMRLPTADLLINGLSVMHHLGKMKSCVIAIAPTGNALLNWARETVSVSIEQMSTALSGIQTPSPVMAIPYVSGAFMFWDNGRDLRAALIGATLATKPADIVQAYMESVAYDHVNTMALLKDSDIIMKAIRATGGGARDVWWTQLKSDITGLPIEVMENDEPGTWGAAILAGKGAGIFSDIDEAAVSASKVIKVYEPDFKRADLHKERMELYNHTIPTLNTSVFSKWC
jgi:xylulokinase